MGCQVGFLVGQMCFPYCCYFFSVLGCFPFSSQLKGVFSIRLGRMVWVWLGWWGRGDPSIMGNISRISYIRTWVLGISPFVGWLSGIVTWMKCPWTPHWKHALRTERTTLSYLLILNVEGNSPSISTSTIIWGCHQGFMFVKATFWVRGLGRSLSVSFNTIW